MLASALLAADALEGHVSSDGEACMSGQLCATPPAEHFQGWSRQSTTVPGEDDEARVSGEFEAKLLGARAARFLSHASRGSTASGSPRGGSGASTPAAVEAEAEGGADEGSGSEAKGPEAVRLIELSARRPALGATDLGDLSDSETDDEETVLSIRLAVRRLALGLASDSDSDSEVEEAAARMGGCARRWATSGAGAHCQPQAMARASDDAESDGGEEDDVTGFQKGVRQRVAQEAEL